MNKAHVIKKAILSEKAYKQMEKGVYTFLVDDRARKDQIAAVVESQFDVKVKKVNVATFAPKQKRIAKTRKSVLTGGGKKAIVYLASGQNIPLLSPKKAGKKTKGQDDKKIKESKKEEDK